MIEEGSRCVDADCIGHMEYQPKDDEGGCTCFSVAPCSFCTDGYVLVCDCCGEVYED